MSAQRILLRILLCSLAIAAVLGACVVLVAPNEIAAKMIGTLLLTAAACGLFLAASKHSDPAAVVAAVALVAVEFVLGLGLIWDIPTRLGWDEDRIAVLTLVLGGPGAASIACLCCRSRRTLAVASRAGLAFSAVVLALWLVADAHLDQQGDTQWWKFWEYGGCLAALAVPICGALIGAGTDRRYWRWIGVVCAAAAYILIVPQVGQHDWSNQPATALVTVAVLVAYVNVVLNAPLPSGQAWVVYADIAAAVATGIFVNREVMQPNLGRLWTPTDRAVGACAILWGFGTIILAILARMARRQIRPAGESAGPLDVTVICPLCNHRQILPAGRGDCRHCQAHIEVTVVAPLGQARAGLI
jgi:uncharacterized membrane protein YfcA